MVLVVSAAVYLSQKMQWSFCQQPMITSVVDLCIGYWGVTSWIPRPVNHLLKTHGRRSPQLLARATVLRVTIRLQLVVTWSLRWVILQILLYCSPDHELTMWVSQLRLLVPSALCCSSPLPLKTWLKVDEEPTVRNTGAPELWEAQLNKIPLSIIFIFLLIFSGGIICEWMYTSDMSKTRLVGT
jgi:hypothetical protein